MDNKFIKNRAKVYKFRVEQKIKKDKLPTITELATLKQVGIDTTEYAAFAIKKYKQFLGSKNV